jgi:hypothetical protein
MMRKKTNKRVSDCWDCHCESSVIRVTFVSLRWCNPDVEKRKIGLAWRAYCSNPQSVRNQVPFPDRLGSTGQPIVSIDGG